MGDFTNVYDDPQRASAYAGLDFPGTYYLAYRDLPSLFDAYVRGHRALDFGCGTGRSTRFLRNLGFSVIGVDVSAPMVARARELDPEGEYHVLPHGRLGEFAAGPYDVVLCAFTFDNIPSFEKKASLLSELGGSLSDGGCLVNVVSSPQIYLHEWASFTTKDFPQNRQAVTGDPVRIVMLDVEDRRPVEDIVWFDEDYHRVYAKARLRALRTVQPLAAGDEPIVWVSETEVAPWTIYVLTRDR